MVQAVVISLLGPCEGGNECRDKSIQDTVCPSAEFVASLLQEGSVIVRYTYLFKPKRMLWFGLLCHLVSLQEYATFCWNF